MASRFSLAPGLHRGPAQALCLSPDMTTPAAHPRDPLHGITLEKILNVLVQRHGWEEMGRCIPIRCFQFDPSVKSSLTFLRKTPWARQKVEAWFVAELPLEEK
jgi:uncharacterized protein (DUF2132 family)